MTVSSSNSLRRHLAVILTAVMLLLGVLSGVLSISAHAAGRIDWGTAVPISQNGQVVDSITVNGKYVEAIYAPRGNVSNYDSDGTYCCAAFVKRFYKNVYGADVWNLYPGNQPSVSSGYFYKTDSPKVGDIAGNSEHWAIVKSVSGGAVTVIEQNAWNTKYTSAMVGRKLYSDSGYWYWRWSGNETSQSSASGSSSESKPAERKYANFTSSIYTPQVSSTNATIKTEFRNPDRIHVKKVGVNLYDANGGLIKKHTEDCSRNESKFYVWYDITGELGLTLKSNTTYNYEFFIIHDGVTYVTDMRSFTTN